MQKHTRPSNWHTYPRCMPSSRSGAKNHDKQLRYSIAFERIEAARRSGFFIEAIMLCESIITDRLVSHLATRRQAGAPISVATVRKYFDECRSHMGEPTQTIGFVPAKHLVSALADHFDDHGDSRFNQLPERLRTWLDDRNAAAHAFVKSHPLTKTFPEPMPVFEARLRSCSSDGLRLARALDAWARRKATKAL